MPPLSCFLKLPPEIRNTIYEMVVTRDKPVVTSKIIRKHCVGSTYRLSVKAMGDRKSMEEYMTVLEDELLKTPRVIKVNVRNYGFKTLLAFMKRMYTRDQALPTHPFARFHVPAGQNPTTVPGVFGDYLEVSLTFDSKFSGDHEPLNFWLREVAQLEATRGPLRIKYKVSKVDMMDGSMRTYWSLLRFDEPANGQYLFIREALRDHFSPRPVYNVMVGPVNINLNPGGVANNSYADEEQELAIMFERQALWAELAQPARATNGSVRFEPDVEPLIITRFRSGEIHWDVWMERYVPAADLERWGLGDLVENARAAAAAAETEMRDVKVEDEDEWDGGELNGAPQPQGLATFGTLALPQAPHYPQHHDPGYAAHTGYGQHAAFAPPAPFFQPHTGQLQSAQPGGSEDGEVEMAESETAGDGFSEDESMESDEEDYEDFYDEDMDLGGENEDDAGQDAGVY